MRRREPLAYARDDTALRGIGPIALGDSYTAAVRRSRGLAHPADHDRHWSKLGVLQCSRGATSGNIIRPTAGVILWASVMLANSLRLDSGDIDLIDSLESLPLPPLTICAGEIIAPGIGDRALFHFSIIVMALIAAPEHRRI